MKKESKTVKIYKQALVSLMHKALKTQTLQKKKVMTQGRKFQESKDILSLTQMPHQDFMNALGQVGNIFASHNFKEVKDRIVINEISFDWDEIKEKTKLKKLLEQI